jgi:hypothetical protein
MKLVQLILPRYDNKGARLPAKLFAQERKTLLENFGGVTAHIQAPAVGLWKNGPRTVRDEIVIYEVMVTRYSRVWWKSHRRALEHAFRQEEILIRAITIETV